MALVCSKRLADAHCMPNCGNFSAINAVMCPTLIYISPTLTIPHKQRGLLGASWKVSSTKLLQNSQEIQVQFQTHSLEMTSGTGFILSLRKRNGLKISKLVWLNSGRVSVWVEDCQGCVLVLEQWTCTNSPYVSSSHCWSYSQEHFILFW